MASWGAKRAITSLPSRCREVRAHCYGLTPPSLYSNSSAADGGRGRNRCADCTLGRDAAATRDKLALRRGMPLGESGAPYHLSFWSVPYRTRTGCSVQIPYMAGFLGNLVVLLRNGISAFRFADGSHYAVDTMVLAGEALRPFPSPAWPAWPHVAPEAVPSVGAVPLWPRCRHCGPYKHDTSLCQRDRRLFSSRATISRGSRRGRRVRRVDRHDRPQYYSMGHMN